MASLPRWSGFLQSSGAAPQLAPFHLLAAHFSSVPGASPAWPVGSCGGVHVMLTKHHDGHMDEFAFRFNRQNFERSERATRLRGGATDAGRAVAGMDKYRRGSPLISSQDGDPLRRIVQRKLGTD